MCMQVVLWPSLIVSMATGVCVYADVCVHVCVCVCVCVFSTQRIKLGVCY